MREISRAQNDWAQNGRLDATIKIQAVVRGNAARRSAAHVAIEAVEASPATLRQELYIAWKIKAANDLKVALHVAEIGPE